MARLSERVSGAWVGEGRARIFVPKGAFFNNGMRFCRDLSVLAVAGALAGKKVRAVDATSGTGVRAIRYAKECGNAVGELFLVDVNRIAATAAKKNLKTNKVSGRVFHGAFARFSCSDSAIGGFGLVEIDPFGSPVPFIHDACRVARDGSILSVTATDTAVLCGAHPKACLKNYHAKPLNAWCCHEVGARILLAKIARAASELNYGIAPLLSLSHKHYFKLAIRLEGGAEKAVESVKECGFVAHCNKCLSSEWRKGAANPLPEKCGECGESREFAGPLWLGRLHDKATLKKILSLNSRGMKCAEIKKIVSQMAAEEGLPPLYYELHIVSKRMREGAAKPKTVCSELSRRGFRCAETHFHANSIKTDAPGAAVKAAVRAARNKL